VRICSPPHVPCKSYILGRWFKRRVVILENLHANRLGATSLQLRRWRKSAHILREGEDLESLDRTTAERFLVPGTFYVPPWWYMAVPLGGGVLGEY